MTVKSLILLRYYIVFDQREITGSRFFASSRPFKRFHFPLHLLKELETLTFNSSSARARLESYIIDYIYYAYLYIRIEIGFFFSLTIIHLVNSPRYGKYICNLR